MTPQRKIGSELPAPGCCSQSQSFRERNRNRSDREACRSYDLLRNVLDELCSHADLHPHRVLNFNEDAVALCSPRSAGTIPRIPVRLVRCRGWFHDHLKHAMQMSAARRR
jgi:hypothetical protein